MIMGLHFVSARFHWKYHEWLRVARIVPGSSTIFYLRVGSGLLYQADLREVRYPRQYILNMFLTLDSHLGQANPALQSLA